LLSQFEKTIDLLQTKYFQAIISYDKFHRIEQYPYPDKALREALLNAIVHKD
jgi:ATP-dependent DNA helicase RecG